LLLVFASTVILGSKSLGTHDHILVPELSGSALSHSCYCLTAMTQYDNLPQTEKRTWKSRIRNRKNVHFMLSFARRGRSNQRYFIIIVTDRGS
jgi:hypothetical protein